MAKVVGVALIVYGAYTGNPYAINQGYLIIAGDDYARYREIKTRRAREAAFRAAQKDRLELVERDPSMPRALVMGRVRYVQGCMRPWQSGTYDEVLTLPVIMAGHEIDGIEQHYLGDAPVTLDGSGWVNEAPWASSVPEPHTATGTLDGAGSASINLGVTPLGSPAPSAVWETGAGENLMQGSASVSMAGMVANVSGGQPSSAVTVTYWLSSVTKRVRIRSYLGGSSQNIGAALSAEYPGKLRSTDKYQGMAVSMMDCVYDQDVFPQGRPTLSAVMRGAKLYDPRKDSTVTGGSGAHRFNDPTTWEWSENPALQVLRYFTDAYGWRRPIDEISLADVIEAANVCDVSTTFNLRKADGSTSTVTLPRFRCGIAISSAADRRESMDAIMETMGARWVWVGGIFRFRAAAKRTAVATLNESWLAEMLDATGNTSGDAVFSGSNGVTRDRRFNRITGRCYDPDQRYQQLPFPAVQDDVLVADKGIRADELDLEGVNHIAHAQHLASMTIRKAQAGMRIEAQCNMRALLLEPLDVLTFALPEYGFAGNEAEVTSWRWHPDNTVTMQLDEVSSGMFTVEAELRGRDPAPASTLRRPWEVEDITGLSVTSGTTATQDGSVLTRVVLEWDQTTGQSIRAGGKVEVQYTEASGALPAGDWVSWEELGTAVKATINGPAAGRYYWFRARAVQLLPLVRGKWTDAVRHFVAPPPDSALYSLDLGIPAITLAADSAGAVGSFAGATTTVRVLRSGVDDTTSWTLGKVDGSGITSTLSTGTLAVTAMSGDSGYIDVTATRSGYAPLTQRLTVSKSKSGAAGSNGTSVYSATVWNQASSAPSAPTGGSYNFSTGSLTAPIGWSTSLPAPGADATYAATIVFSTTTPASTVTGGTWSTPVQVAAGASVGPVVSPGNFFVTDAQLGTTDASAAFQVRRDGSIWEVVTLSSTATKLADWYDPNGTSVGDDYDVRLDLIYSYGSSGGESGPGFSTWVALTSDRLFSLVTTESATTLRGRTYSYTIRLRATGQTVSSGQVNLEAVVE